MNNLFPILSESQFRVAAEEFYRKGHVDDPALACCLYLVVAIGARSSRETSVSKTHFAAAWTLYDAVVASPYILSVQALVLMVSKICVISHCKTNKMSDHGIDEL